MCFVLEVSLIFFNTLPMRFVSIVQSEKLLTIYNKNVDFLDMDFLTLFWFSIHSCSQFYCNPMVFGISSRETHICRPKLNTSYFAK